MSHLNKLLLIFVNIIFFISCASNLPNSLDQNRELISIAKPNIVYNFKKLPERINIFLSDSLQNEERELINGLSINYYYYKNNFQYSPDIVFITRKRIDANDCQLNEAAQNYSIIFLNNSFLKDLDPNCLNKLLNFRGLLISLNKNLNIKELNREILSVNRFNDHRDLLIYAKNKGSKNSLIIDDNNTRDKEIIEQMWSNLGAEIVTSSTSGSALNENFLSNLLHIESSKERSRKLSRVLSVALESIPRRRMDLDSIILSTSLSKARSLKPELEYNFGETLSVYLLPNWDINDYYLQKELDLENVVLIDMPWMFNTEIPYLKNPSQKRNRNYAIGYDAYELALLLSNPSSSKQFTFFGMSGKITYNRGNFVRQSLKVSVVDGSFRAIGY